MEEEEPHTRDFVGDARDFFGNSISASVIEAAASLEVHGHKVDDGSRSCCSEAAEMKQADLACIIYPPRVCYQAPSAQASLQGRPLNSQTCLYGACDQNGDDI